MKKARPLVSVIVINHNGKNYLNDCFGALGKLDYPKERIEIIMVDNCSTDDSIGFIKAYFPAVKVLKNDINNYCRANNIGIKHAKGGFIALLNNDTKVDRKWMSELVDAISSDNKIGAVGSKVLFMDGSVESTCHKKLPDFYWIDRKTEMKNDAQSSSIEEVESLCGCSILYRKASIEDAGEFDEDFNMYLEDIDMAIRLRNKKWKLVYASKSILFHAHRGTAKEDRAWYLSERNRLYLIAKHFPEKLSSAMLGNGYFTAQKGIESEGMLYEVANDIVMKLLKHHKRDLISRVLKDLFTELKKITAHENIILKGNIEKLLSVITSHEKGLEEKDLYIDNLNLEINNRNNILKQKDEHIDNLNLSIGKKDIFIQDLGRVLQEKDIHIKSLGGAIKQKDDHINGLNIEMGKKDIQIESLGDAIKQKDERINNLSVETGKKDIQIKSLDKEIMSRSALLEQKEIHIGNLNLELERRGKVLENIYNSTMFRFLVKPVWTMLWKIKLFLNIRTIEIKPDPAGIQKNKTSDMAICTIISKNYLSYARVLTGSFLEHNKGEVFVLLTDRVDGYFDPKNEKFTLIEIETLKDRVGRFEEFTFQYSPTELNTAIKPFFLEHLFEKYNLQKIVFFDPDILITYNLDHLSKLLDDFSIILTPHITQPYKDTSKPSEIDILQSGVYNLGFIALSNKPSTKTLLKWWKERLKRYCLVDREKGLFVDQKWIDLVPGFFKDVYILRDETYNAAYWNFHYRDVDITGSNILVNNKQAHFIHFSGVMTDNLNDVSKHQDRFKLRDLKNMRRIFDIYKDRLMTHGYKESRAWPCIFNYFDNGVKITDLIRALYWDMRNCSGVDFGNPFNTSGRKTYFNWLNKEVDAKKPPITEFMLGIYKKRIDVHAAYPDIFGSHREGFVKWFIERAQIEHGFDNIFLKKSQAFNSKHNRMTLEFFKSRLFWKTRGILKAPLKKIFKNNLLMINYLKRLEWNFSKKISAKKNNSMGSISNGLCVNVIGYLTAELGVGEAARSSVKCIEAVGGKMSLINISEHGFSRRLDPSFADFTTDVLHDINLIHVNADMLPRLFMEKRTRWFNGKYNIGFWNWELPEFPDEWLESFDYCDEVWVPSNFTFASVSKSSPVPVFKIPIAVNIDNIKDIKRSYFNLKDDECIFLFIFDFFSLFERKNPLGIIEAFKKAFSVSEKAKLVIKCANSSYNPRAMDGLRQAIKGHNIDIIDRYLYRDEVNALISLCDAYVSLHRSEGYGLTMAEAMFLGKPVIATGFSANMDFMNISNSYPVKYKLTDIAKDAGPYKKGNIWAEPDTCHAAELMRYVYENVGSAKAIGKIASEDIKQNLNYHSIGNLIKNRLSSKCLKIYE